MTSFTKPNWYQQPPSSIQRLEAANIVYGTKSRLSPKLSTAIGALGGKARYIISFLLEATTVGKTSILELHSRNAIL